MGKVFTITEGLENMGALKSGGQGSVFKARRMGAIITAVKMLPTPVFTENDSDKSYADFQSEVQKLKQVNEQPNPHVVSIVGHGITESGSFPFIEMEFIDGPDVEELLQPPNNPVFTIKEAVKVATQLASALAHCHKVDVKHGDIKSNNVKFNSRTGNYMLLDFGLAMLSDEVRRTSLRRAGSVEFMAPEQSEGQLLFQSDIYGFGVILFELLAGEVPFPLTDNSETARNIVMLAQQETTPPDILELRKEHLPPQWDKATAAQEMAVPAWLLHVVYKCLEKAPQDRYAHGGELLDAICAHAMPITQQHAPGEALLQLQTENRRLLQKNKELQHRLNRQNKWKPGFRGSALLGGSTTTRAALIAGGLLLVAVLAWIGFLLWPTHNGGNQLSLSKARAVQPKSTLGQYKVAAPRAYFFSQPREGNRQAAYLMPSSHIIAAIREENGFVYTEFTSNNNKLVKGWLRQQDLMEMAASATRGGAGYSMRRNDADVDAQLQAARRYLADSDTVRALAIYDSLSRREVPEAMYAYGNMALQNRHTAIDCKKAYELVNQASRDGYTPAKTTVGFLLVFGADNNRLQAENYGRCTFRPNITRGAQLLIEATLEGDTAAKKWLKQLNQQQPAAPVQ